MYVDIFNTNNQYDLIVADPPWRQSKGGKKSVRPNTSGKNLDYPTCSIEEIRNHLKVATDLREENSILFRHTFSIYSPIRTRILSLLLQR